MAHPTAVDRVLRAAAEIWLDENFHGHMHDDGLNSAGNEFASLAERQLFAVVRERRDAVQ